MEVELKCSYNITSEVNHYLQCSDDFKAAVDKAVTMFNNCDWGEIPAEDKEANLKDLMNKEGHILGKYNSPEGELYINMEFDENKNGIAVIMFCHEY